MKHLYCKGILNCEIDTTHGAPQAGGKYAKGEIFKKNLFTPTHVGTKLNAL